MLQRVKYVTPHFFEKQKYKIRLLKWYLNDSNWLNSHVIYKNSYFRTDADVFRVI